MTTILITVCLLSNGFALVDHTKEIQYRELFSESGEKSELAVSSHIDRHSGDIYPYQHYYT